MTTTIYVFQTAGFGTFTMIGARSLEEAYEQVQHTDVELVGTVPADEFYMITATSPTILYQKEAAAIRASRSKNQKQSNVSCF